MKECMQTVQSWMEQSGMSVSIDAVGNLRGFYPAHTSDAARLMIGSHLDTVPDAGAFDGVLGVMLAIALVEHLNGHRFNFAIEVVAFSEEEGVRFAVPFIGSRALIGRLDNDILSRKDREGISVEQAIVSFGLSFQNLSATTIHPSAAAFLEFHIEQGPVLENAGLSLGVVDAIAGQTRGEIIFIGKASHAGTTPMHLRHDAVAGAAEWIIQVEDIARSTQDLVATIGKVDVSPGVGNVVVGQVRMSFDVRHAKDKIRNTAVTTIVDMARATAQKRELKCECHFSMDQPAIPMDTQLTTIAIDAIRKAGVEPLRMISGAGHDAMIMAERLPSAMIFLRSPGGISHHPDETVRREDVENAVLAGITFLNLFDKAIGTSHA
jgi:allantoate deiminase